MPAIRRSLIWACLMTLIMLLVPVAGILPGSPMSAGIFNDDPTGDMQGRGDALSRADPDWKAVKSGEFSFQIDPTHDVVIEENMINGKLEATPSYNVYYTINATARKAVDKVPAWLNESLCWKFSELTDQQQVNFANLLLNASLNASYIDELAYTISHMPLQILTYPSTDIQLFVENIDTMYKISRNLKYAKIVDTNRADGLHTTVVYAVPGGNITLPEEIYYQYVASPRGSREAPVYINTTTLSAGNHNTGVFWRTYLYNRTTDVGYPVLADYLKNETYLWKGLKNNVTDNGAVGAVSRWEREVVPTFGIVGTTRSSQSVIIYKNHWGMCGENSDILGAAGKIALIPTVSTLNLEAWHGWNEFYERGWHQWEAYSNNVDNPWAEGGYGGTSVFTSLEPDSDQLSATEHYTAVTNFTVNVRDANGWPIAGALVEITTTPNYNAYNGIGLIGNATDGSGKVMFKIGINFDYYVHVYSSCGSYPAAADSLVLAVTNAKAGVNYTYNMTLSGRISTQMTVLYNDGDIFLDRYNISVKDIRQSVRNYMDPWYSHTIWNSYTDRYGLWVLFLSDENLTKYQASQPYVAARLMRLEGAWNTTTLPAGHWNIVVTGRYQAQSHTAASINVTLEQYTGKPRAVILQPGPGTYLITQYINFSGKVEPYIQQLGPYSYRWEDNLTGQFSTQQSFQTVLGLGYHNITLVVSNASGEVSRDWVHMLVKYPNRAPSAEISEPDEGQVYDYLDMCSFSANGSSDPDGDLMTYDWAVPDIGYWMSSLPYFSILLPPGNYTVVLTVADPLGLNDTAMVNITCLPQDLPPEALIKYPGDNLEYYNDTKVPLSAQGSFDPEGRPLTYIWTSSIDGVISTLAQDEVYLSAGNHTVTVWVNDSRHSASDSVEIRVINRTYVIEHPPVAAISSPYNGNTYYISDVIAFSSKGSYDPDGLPLTYKWTLNGLIVSEAAQFSDKLEEGQHILELEVSDGSLQANVSIGFKVVDRPPVISIIHNGTELNGSSAFSYKENEEVKLDAVGSFDPDGGTVTFMWYLGPSQVSPFPAWEPVLEPGKYAIRLEVKDEGGKVSVKYLDLTVIEAQEPIDDDVLPNQTTNQTEPDDKEDYTVLYFVLAILVLVAVAAVTAFIVIRNRNKEAEAEQGPSPAEPENKKPKTKAKKVKGKKQISHSAKISSAKAVGKAKKEKAAKAPPTETTSAKGDVFELDEEPGEDEIGEGMPSKDAQTDDAELPPDSLDKPAEGEVAEGIEDEAPQTGEAESPADAEDPTEDGSIPEDGVEDEFEEPDDVEPALAIKRQKR